LSFDPPPTFVASFEGNIVMKRPIKGACAAVALAALTSAAIAQTSDITVAQVLEKGGAPAGRQAPPAARSAPPPAARSAPAPAPRAVARPPSQRPAATQRSRPERPAAVQRAPQQRAVERSRVRERAVERNRARERTQQQVQERRQQSKERRAQPTPQPPTPKQVDKGPPRPDVAGKQGQKGAQPVARVQATDQQRREVRQQLFKDRRVQRIPRGRLNVALAVGSRIPRHHRLHRFTPALLALVPIYAAYQYIIVEDTICVVDPETYAVVDIIPATIEQAGPLPGSRPALALSAEQMQCVHASVPKDRARANVRIRLALGAEIPRRVRLFAFPNDALACSPDLAAYRYIVVENDVVIVDPADYAIALVISA
jgi:hypothetical protein